MMWRALIAALIILPAQVAFAFDPDFSKPIFSSQERADQYISSSADIADVASPDQVAAELGYAPNARVKAPSKARLQILIDKAVRHQKESGSKTGQTLEMYLDGILIGKYNVSTGREQRELAKSGRRYFSSTPTGTYGIYHRNPRHWSRTWKAWMPYSQFLVGGIAIHATTPDHYNELGSRASGGCIRLTNKNAKTLWDLVNMVGAKNTSVTIFDSTKQFNWMTEMSGNSQQVGQKKAKRTEEQSSAADLNRRELERLQNRRIKAEQEYQEQLRKYYEKYPQMKPKHKQEPKQEQATPPMQDQLDAPMPEKFLGIY